MRLPHPVLQLAAVGGATAAEGPWAVTHGHTTAGGGRMVVGAAAAATTSIGGGFGLFRRVLSGVSFDLSA